MYKYRITVFTPTYNRAYIIGKLYQSLCAQSFTDFEWLIVDDGSDDDTEEMVKDWQLKSHFCIRYFKTENGGKHRAINYGLDKAEGELFFTMDSDDELTFDALEKVDKWFAEIVGKPELCGVVANKGLAKEYTPNAIFKEPYLDKSWLETYSYLESGKQVLGGERAIIFYTDIHKKYHFPEFNGEKFITEAVVYNRIAHDGYKLRFYNDIIWVYEYQEDGLTKAGNSIFIRNPLGYGLWIKEKAQFNNYSLREKIKIYYQFTCDLLPTYDLTKIAECLNVPNWIIKILYLVHVIRGKTKRK